MEAIKNLIPVLLTISLAGLVLTVGMKAQSGELGFVLKRPRLLGPAVLSVLILPPLVAGLLIWALPLTLPVKAGIMLMAVAPVPPLVPGKELKAGARQPYAYGLYFAMAILTVISVPVVFKIASELFGRDDEVPFANIYKLVLMGVIAPLILGIVIRRLAPDFAEKWAGLVYKISMALVVLAFLPILITVWPAMLQLMNNGALLAMAVVVAICMAIGHFLGGPEPADRATLAVASSVRHPGIAIALASANFGDPHVKAAVLLFMLVGMVVGVGYSIWFKRWLAGRTPAAA